LPARLTPYELVFGDAAFEADRFEAIRAETEARGSAEVALEAFPFLGEVGELLGELLPDNSPASVFMETAAFVFQSYQFWLNGKRLFVLHPDVARYCVEPWPPTGRRHFVAPARAGYLQLPRHLFWARVADSGTPEPVDGFFWHLSPRSSDAGAAGVAGTTGAEDAESAAGAAGAEDAERAAGTTGAEDAARTAGSTTGEVDPAAEAGAGLEVLLVLGLRGDRPGLSTIRIGADPAAVESGHWCDEEGRPGGEDFANVLPGGEMEGLHSLLTEAEVLKLVSRCFFYMDKWPSSLAAVEACAPAEGEPAARETVESAFALPPSVLPHKVILSVNEAGSGGGRQSG